VAKEEGEPLTVDDPYAPQRTLMVQDQLERRGLRDERVLDAMRTLPRHHFIPHDRVHLAYRDQAVPLEQGQTISQPYMVAAMTEALALRPHDRVLEIGTGSGYQTAIIAELAAEVFTIERLPSLTETAEYTLRDLGIGNVEFRVGDGSMGWPEEAPFDGIMVTAGAPAPPESLTSQLSPEGGRLVIPVGDREIQTLYRYTRTGEEITREDYMACRFVPLLGEEGW
jgi:protein-L-isoaspartate(D-aspartate) O-methyltransferase